MRIRLLALWSLLFIVQPAFSQPADLNRLLKNLSNAEGEDKLTAINDLANYYYNLDSISELRFYLDEAFKLIERNKNLPDIRRSYLLQSNYLLLSGHLEESLEYSDLGLIKTRQAKDRKTEAQLYKNLAEAHARLFNMQLARDYVDSTLIISEEIDYMPGKTAALNILAFLEDNEGNKEAALKIFQELADEYEAANSIEYAIVLNNIGELHRKMGNFDHAISYYLQSLEISERLKDLSSIQRAFSNLGATYLEMDSIQQSKNYYLKSSELAKRLNDRYQRAVIFHNLSSVKMADGEYDLADAYVDSSMQLCSEQNYIYGFVMNENRYGEIDLKRNQIKEALSHFQKAAKYAESLGLSGELVMIYKAMHDVYKLSGDNKNAMLSLEKKYRLEDSLLLIEKNNIILELQNRYEKEKKGKEILSLKQDLLIKQNNTRIIFIAALLFLLGFSTILFVLILNRRKLALEESLSASENELLKKDLAHKNKELADFAHFSSESQMQTETLVKRLSDLKTENNPELRNKVMQFQHKLTGLSPIQAWKDFESRFDKVHSGFYDKLMSLSPDLTPNELRLCSLLHLELSTKEIAEIMNRTVGTIDNARSSIRKKLKLDNDENLSALLKSL